MQQNIRLVSIFNFLTDFHLLGPLAIIYFTQVTGSFTLGMSIFSIAMLAGAIFELPTGVISDRVGRKKTIIFGSIASVISVTCYAIGMQYWWLAAGAVFEGAARAFFSGNNNAYLFDLLKEERLEKKYHYYLGKTSSMFQLALALSALLGGLVASISFALMVWLDLIPAIGKLLVSFFMKDTRKYDIKSSNIYSDLKFAVAFFIKNPRLRSLSLASMSDFAIGESSFQFKTAFVATLWPVWAIGLSRVFSNLGASFSFYISGRIIQKYKELAPIVIGMIYSKIINVIALIFPTVASPAIMSTTSIFYGVSSVAETNLLQKEFTDEQRATMSSLNALGGSVLFSIIALALGFLADIMAPAGALLIFQALGLIPLFIYIRLFRKHNTISHGRH
jgi:MFS family permease